VVRLHLPFTAARSTWTAEAGPIRVWIDESSQGKPEKRLLEFVHKANLAPTNQRNIDFEFQTSSGAENPVLKGFVLFHICDDEGVCYYNRQNFEIRIETTIAESNKTGDASPRE